MTKSVSRNRRQVALVFLLAAVLVSSGIATDRPLDAGTGLRGQMLQLTNDDRTDKDRSSAGAGSPALPLRQEALAGHGGRAGSFPHGRPRGQAEGRGLVRRRGERRLASNLSDGSKPPSWRSTPHRRNILNREFDHVAIGVVESDGNFWVTVIFYG